MNTRDLYNQRVGKYRSLQDRSAELSTERSGLEEQVGDLAEAFDVLEAAADGIRDSISEQLTQLLTGAMKDVFGPETGCRLYYRQLPSHQYRPVFEAWDEDGVAGDPTEVLGGSAVEVIALGLRIYFLVRCGQSRILILDEPLRGIDSTNVHAVGQWLRQICHELGIQLIMVSHIGEGIFENVADKVFVVEKVDGVSSIQEADHACSG